MKALHLWFLVATTLIAASVTMADTADISGLAYYAGNVIDDRDGQCYPITGATVNLYKRTANNGWQQFGDAIEISIFYEWFTLPTKFVNTN